MEVRVDDKVLLVTGAAQGVGRAVALEAFRSGAAAIILTDRNTQRGVEVLSEMSKLGGKVAFVAADLDEQAAGGCWCPIRSGTIGASAGRPGHG